MIIDQEIGLENERLLEETLTPVHSSVEKLFDGAAKVFKSSYPKLNLFAEFYLNDNGLSFRKMDISGL
jgi:hypothetical protein